MSSQSQISYGRQWIEDDDIEAVVAVLRGAPLTQGPQVQAFEAELAAKVGARHCVAFANATAGLHCAVKALDLPIGEKGVTSPITFVASANCMAYNGLVPTFGDVDPATTNISPESLEAAIHGGAKLAIPVHFAGQPCDMAAIGAIARRHGTEVIEDASHAIGSIDADGSPVGSCRHSRMTVFSFHPVKTMTTGEGGAVTTNDPSLYQRLLRLRSHGITKDPASMERNPGPWHYEQHELGFNYRITDIQCALGRSQLAKLDRFKALRQAIVARYDRELSGIPGLVLPRARLGTDNCLHLYATRIDFATLGRTRSQVMASLAALGIATQVHYIPVHLQPWYRETYGYGPGLAPAAEAYFEQALSLPLFAQMTPHEVDRVISAVRNVLS